MLTFRNHFYTELLGIKMCIIRIFTESGWLQRSSTMPKLFAAYREFVADSSSTKYFQFCETCPNKQRSVSACHGSSREFESLSV